MKRNYQQEMEAVIQRHQSLGEVPSLLLHSCCAPCSSYVLEALSSCFHITIFYFNPNIYPATEYAMRVREQEQFISRLPAKYPLSFAEGAYDRQRFWDIAKGLEDVPEGGERCFRCYALRLREAGEYAASHGFDYFTTTLSISPRKNAEKLNEIGEAIAAEVGVPYLVSDFKKKGGFLRSVELSREYGMYRQDYCGCEFSLRERQAQQSSLSS